MNLICILYRVFHNVSVITYIYNKKTKGPTVMELFTATGKLENFFLTTTDVQCVHHGWHGTHWYDIQVLATHMSTATWFLLAQTPSFSKLFIPRTNGLVFRRVLCVLCTKCTLHSNHRLTHVMFQHKMASPPEWPFSHYIHSHHLVAEMWTTMKNNLLGKTFLSCSFYLYRFRKYVSCGFPIINFCNPRVHYETPCI